MYNRVEKENNIRMRKQQQKKGEQNTLCEQCRKKISFCPFFPGSPLSLTKFLLSCVSEFRKRTRKKNGKYFVLVSKDQVLHKICIAKVSCASRQQTTNQKIKEVYRYHQQRFPSPAKEKKRKNITK